MTEPSTWSRVTIDVTCGTIAYHPPDEADSDKLSLTLDDWLTDPAVVTKFISHITDEYADDGGVRDKLTVEAADGTVGIHGRNDGTLVEWRRDEWASDPALVYTIARAVADAYENPDALCTLFSAHPSVEEA